MYLMGSVSEPLLENMDHPLRFEIVLPKCREQLASREEYIIDLVIAFESLETGIFKPWDCGTGPWSLRFPGRRGSHRPCPKRFYACAGLPCPGR